MIIILSALWILMHVGGGVMRSILYADPFLSDPEDPTGSKIYGALFKRCGP